MTADEVARVLREHDGFLIMSHSDPDGDSVGSQLALCSVLRRLGKRAWAVSDEPVPAIYRFLVGDIRVEPMGAADGADVAVVVDSSNLRRVSGLASLEARKVDILNIDHHRSNTGFGRWNYVDPGACACAEQIYSIVQRLDVRLTQDEASCLYVGILTDTGAFRFPNTTSACLRIAADLVDAGFCADCVARKVFWEKTPESTHLLGLALSGLEVSHGGRIATMVVSREMSRQASASDADSDGFASYTKVIAGVKVGLLLRDSERGVVRVSLRSDAGVDVERVARVFGGGGHPTSAGCVLEGSLGSVKTRVLEEVVQLLDGPSEQPRAGHGRGSGS